jgi:leishmanolysin-like peptidase
MLRLLAAAACTVAVAASQAAKPPHLVFFLADDQGNHDIGFHSANITSPHIDALQKAGRELKRHYVFKYCSPTRAALLSGRLPYHAHQWNLDAGRPGGTTLAFTLMPAMLKRFGYAAHLVGKWHGGMSRRAFLPTSRGFDSSIGVLSGGHDHITQKNPGQGCSAWSPTLESAACAPLPLPPDANGTVEKERAAGNDCAGGVVDYWQSERTGSPGEGGCTATACPVPNGTFEPYSLNARALSIVAAHSPSRPLYLHYTPHMIHTPLERSPTMPSEFVNGTECGCDERCTLQSMVSVLDSLVANLTAALTAKGMMKNLVFVYSVRLTLREQYTYARAGWPCSDCVLGAGRQRRRRADRLQLSVQRG